MNRLKNRIILHKQATLKLQSSACLNEVTRKHARNLARSTSFTGGEDAIDIIGAGAGLAAQVGKQIRGNDPHAGGLRSNNRA